MPTIIRSWSQSIVITIILLISGYHFAARELQVGGILTMLSAWGLSYQVFRWLREDHHRSIRTGRHIDF